jgi:hypothetical protein
MKTREETETTSNGDDAVADRFLAKGQVAQTAMFALTVVHMSASRPVIRMGSGSGRTRSS